MVNIKKKSQSWSIDIALGVIIFMIAFFIFYGFLGANSDTKVGALRREASTVSQEIASQETLLSIIDGNEVNVSKLNELKNLSYEELKRMFRIENDFCIYFEDDRGYLVLINNSYKGIGSSAINISGTPCSQK